MVWVPVVFDRAGSSTSGTSHRVPAHCSHLWVIKLSTYKASALNFSLPDSQLTTLLTRLPDANPHHRTCIWILDLSTVFIVMVFAQSMHLPASCLNVRSFGFLTTHPDQSPHHATDPVAAMTLTLPRDQSSLTLPLAQNHRTAISTVETSLVVCMAQVA